jgi:hypothetical protein
LSEAHFWVAYFCAFLATLAFGFVFKRRLSLRPIGSMVADWCRDQFRPQLGRRRGRNLHRQANVGLNPRKTTFSGKPHDLLMTVGIGRLKVQS